MCGLPGLASGSGAVPAPASCDSQTCIHSAKASSVVRMCPFALTLVQQWPRLFIIAPTARTPWVRVQEKAAETGMLIAYRTVQYPQVANCSESGKAYDHQVGYRYHVTYLNSAGRQVGVLLPSSQAFWLCLCWSISQIPTLSISWPKPVTCTAMGGAELIGWHAWAAGEELMDWLACMRSWRGSTTCCWWTWR